MDTLGTRPQRANAPKQGSHLDNPAPRGHWTTSGDICGFWHRGGGGQGCCSTPCRAQDSSKMQERSPREKALHPHPYRAGHLLPHHTAAPPKGAHAHRPQEARPCMLPVYTHGASQSSTEGSLHSKPPQVTIPERATPMRDPQAPPQDPSSAKSPEPSCAPPITHLPRFCPEQPCPHLSPETQCCFPSPPPGPSSPWDPPLPSVTSKGPCLTSPGERQQNHICQIKPPSNSSPAP